MNPTIIATVGKDNILEVNGRQRSIQGESLQELVSRIKGETLITDFTNYNNYEALRKAAYQTFSFAEEGFEDSEKIPKLREYIQTFAEPNKGIMLYGSESLYQIALKMPEFQRVVLINDTEEIQTDGNNIDTFKQFPNVAESSEWRLNQVIPKETIVTSIYERK